MLKMTGVGFFGSMPVGTVWMNVPDSPLVAVNFPAVVSFGAAVTDEQPADGLAAIVVGSTAALVLGAGLLADDAESPLEEPEQAAIERTSPPLRARPTSLRPESEATDTALISVRSVTSTEQTMPTACTVRQYAVQ